MPFLRYNNLTALAEAKLLTPERTLKHAAKRHVIDNLTAQAEAELPTPERTLKHAAKRHVIDNLFQALGRCHTPANF